MAGLEETAAPGEAQTEPMSWAVGPAAATVAPGLLAAPAAGVAAIPLLAQGADSVETLFRH
jgi:hypothetical protein